MSAKPKPVCPVCGAKSTDWLLCAACTGSLRDALVLVLPDDRVTRWPLPWELPRSHWAGIEAELTISLARLSKRTPNLIASRVSSVPLPYDQPAADNLRRLRGILSTWVRDIAGEKVPEGVRDGLPWMARYLIEHLDDIRSHLAAEQIHYDIAGAVAQCMTVISPPTSTNHAGPDRSHDVQRALGMLATRTEILGALSTPEMYGVTVSQSRFSHWLSAGRIQARGSTNTDPPYPLYLVGEVVELGKETRGRRKERTMT